MPILPEGQSQDDRGTKQPIDAGQLGSRDDGEITLNREGLLVSNQIPGVPEGWELVRIGVPSDGDWWISMEGAAEQSMSSCITVWPIIRKIEKPARYRPFANADEFKPHRDRWVRIVKEQDERNTNLEDWFGIGSCLKIMGCEESGLWLRVPGRWLTYESAFAEFVFDDDGTPFGVKIDGE